MRFCIRFFLFSLSFLLLNNLAYPQGTVQTVKGRITDAVTGIPVTYAGIRITADDKTYETSTDQKGMFDIQVPPGRYRLIVSSAGYAISAHELFVISGKESITNIALHHAVYELNEVEITGTSLPPDVPGQRVLSIEKTLRIPANFFDPVRVATAYPGVVAANDQANAIIVRGNSPNGLLWRLNGLDIVNPNHLANAGTLSDVPAANGGGVNILSAQMLDKTDFYMGAFPAAYGNALSGVIDMKLREGNKTKHEYTAQASLIGMDVAAEGPVGKNKTTSFLANYRYSTVGLLSLAGVDFGDEAITFQDLSFTLDSDFKNGGKLTFFGFGGNSRNKFTHKPSAEWEEDKDKYDIDYTSGNIALGMNYAVPVYKGKLFLGLAYSGSEQERNASISQEADAVTSYLLSDAYQLNNTLLSSNIRYETFLGEKGIFEVGMMTNYVDNSISSLKTTGCLSCATRAYREVNGSNDGILLQPSVNVGFNLSSLIRINAGIRYLQYTYNNTGAVEPRANLNFRLSEKASIDASYGLVSQLQLPQVYAAEGNSNLEFTKSHHVDLAYSHAFLDGLNLRTGIFYQSLFDVPVLSDPTATFSTLNLLEGFAPGNLVNEGTGENYGVDATVEKSFFRHNYFMAGGSYYESKYATLDGVSRNTRFNGNYTLTAVYGKEWMKTEKNRSIGLNARLLYLGGLRQSPVNESGSQSSTETVYNETDPFNEKLDDYIRLDLRLSFRKNKPGYTRTFAIDIQNLLNQENEAYRYYDFTQQRIVTKFQLGIIPVLVYRIDF